jgi:hypothetical protein
VVEQPPEQPLDSIPRRLRAKNRREADYMLRYISRECRWGLWKGEGGGVVHTAVVNQGAALVSVGGAGALMLSCQ